MSSPSNAILVVEMGTTLEGGAFLATLKAKNERAREVKEVAKREASMYKDRRKSSMFGSFFSSTRKSFLIPRTSSGNTTGAELDHGEGAPSNKNNDADNEQEEKRDAPLSAGEENDSQTNDEGKDGVRVTKNAEVPSGDINESVNNPLEISQNSEMMAPTLPNVDVQIIETRKLDHHTDNHSSSAPTFRRTSVSMESFTRRESSTLSEHHADSHKDHADSHKDHASRRMSTSMESFTRRDSSTMSEHHADTHRDRSPSKANMDDVYGRTGKDPRKWEMSNPLLDSSIPTRRLSLSQSALDIEMEQKRRQSLYKSAPHVDQNVLLERRNTRAGRTSIVDVTPPTTQIPGDAPAVE